MKIGFRFGHLKGVDGGAIGILDEFEFNRLYGAKVVEYLKAERHTLIDCTPVSAIDMHDSLWYGVNKANAENVDLFVSFHANAFNGTVGGSEVVCGSWHGLNYGERVVNKLVELGFANRKAYLDVRGLCEIRDTHMTAIIIEPLFVDSESDVKLFNSIGVDRFARAIAEGILDKKLSPLDTKTIASQPVVSASKPIVNTSDSNVLGLQKSLNRLGFKGVNGQRLVEDGVSGANTTFAVKALQNALGLVSDGVAGAITLGAINSITAKPLLKIGVNGVATRFLQFKLGIANDGVFGNGTKSNVVKWQSANKLTADGVFGNISWTKLIG